MATLPYLGPTQTGPADLATVGYINALLANNLTQSQITAQINAALTGYVTKSYVDTQDALNATKTYIDAADNTKLHLSQVNANSGAAGLDATSRVDVARLAVASTQRFPSPFISPAAYNATAITTNAGEVQLYPVSVADPGYNYKLLIFGHVNTSTNSIGENAVIRVRQGATNGPLVASANGLGELYYPGTLTTYTVGSTTPYTYNVPGIGTNTNLDVIAVGSGGSGNKSGQQGGSAGSWATASLLYGTTLPTATTTLSVTVGIGGVYGTTYNGAGCSVTGTGVTTITAAGGSWGSSGSPTGKSPGNQIWNGSLYKGGAAQTSGNGNAPGGGGAGTPDNSQPGNGADGEVWLWAYNTSIPPTGPAAIIGTPLNLQSTLSGSTTLYVMLGRHSNAASTARATTVRPSLYVLPVPA